MALIVINLSNTNLNTIFRWLRSARIVRVSPLQTEADEEEEEEGEESYMCLSMREEEEREE